MEARKGRQQDGGEEKKIIGVVTGGRDKHRENDKANNRDVCNCVN